MQPEIQRVLNTARPCPPEAAGILKDVEFSYTVLRVLVLALERPECDVSPGYWMSPLIHVADLLTAAAELDSQLDWAGGSGADLWTPAALTRAAELAVLDGPSTLTPLTGDELRRLLVGVCEMLAACRDGLLAGGVRSPMGVGATAPH